MDPHENSLLPALLATTFVAARGTSRSTVVTALYPELVPSLTVR